MYGHLKSYIEYVVLFCYSISNSSVQPFTTINYLLRFYVIVLSANEFILKFKIQIFRDYSTLGMRYRDLQAREYKKETRNLTLHEAQPSAVLNFKFLVCKRVLLNLDNA